MTTGRMSLLSPPTLTETLLYVRHNGPWRALTKFLGGYVVGRQTWYVTLEDLSNYTGGAVVPEGLELRFARLDDVPMMTAFAGRMSASVLRTWCGPSYFFFLALVDGRPISYRCLSTQLHPGVAELIRLGPGQLFMVDEFTDPAFRRRGMTRQLALGMMPTLERLGISEVVGIHRTDNHDTIAAANKKGIPRIGTVTRYRVLWHVWFDYLDALNGAAARDEMDLSRGLPERGA